MHKSSNNGNNGKIRTEFYFTVGLGETLGSIISIQTFSDVFVACWAALGVTIGACEFFNLSFEHQKLNVRELLLLFLFCTVGAELTLLFVIVLSALFGVKLTIILLIIMIITAALKLELKMKKTVIKLFLLSVIFSCGCVFIASVVLILEMSLSLLKVYREHFLSSFLFYPVVMLASLMLIIQFRKPLKRIKQSRTSQVSSFSCLLDFILF